MKNEIVIDGEVARIRLNRGWATIDVSDVPVVAPYRWFAEQTRWGPYVARTFSTGGRPRQKKVYLHTHLADPNREFPMVDHRDGDGLNNRRENLRPCSREQNGANRRVSNMKKASRFKGVSLNRGRGPQWKATIVHLQKTRHVGYFDDEESAARAYDRMARTLFGEFAKPNFA